MKFFAEYAKETKEYAKKLKDLAKTQQEETGTMNLGWMAIKQEMESLANVYNRVADDVGYKVIQPVESHLKETSRVKRKVFSSLLPPLFNSLLFINFIL